ncbi:hypothetical protein GGI11_004161 [Coemansia sp. RSA 2049]|nr:hypothetical protein GGI11_004161 [Coemansia sp. RSA 2049]
MVYKRSRYAHNLTLQIVDFDHGSVGQSATQQLIERNQGLDTQPVWIRADGEFSTSEQVREWVRLHGWAALIINSGTSQKLQQAAAGGSNGNALYNPKDAITVYVSSGRLPVAYSLIISTEIQSAVQMVMKDFAVRFIQSIDLDNAAALLSLQQLATIATQPVSYRIVDVAPFTFGISPTLIINGFLVCLLCTVDALIEWKYRTFCFYLRAKHNHLWLATLVLLLAWTTYMGMLAALALSAFEGPGYPANALHFTVGRFFAVWGTTTMTVLATALWLLNWLLILPPDVLGLPSLFTIQPNIACILIVPELAPGFFRWIYALPFYNGAMLLRYILSGAYPHIGTNVGIILGEICVMAVLLYITIGLRQLAVLRGVSDEAGWYRGNIFFDTPVPYYKEEEAGERPGLPICSIINSDARLRVGNLGV